MAGEFRSREARSLAEEALVRLALAAGDDAGKLVVIGGLTPDLLTLGSETPHHGTVDVDLLLEVGVVYDRDELDFAWLESALTEAGFRLRTSNIGWRWSIDIDGIPVVVDVLCDAPDNLGAELALPGTAEVTAQNLIGPGTALLDVREHRVPVPPSINTEVRTVALRFAGLGGYLLAKAAAVARRGAPKDFYDFAYVVLYNAEGGPEAAARAAAGASQPRPHHDPWMDLTAAVTAFREPGSDAVTSFADEMIAVGATATRDILVRDAVTAVRRFSDALGLDAPPSRDGSPN